MVGVLARLGAALLVSASLLAVAGRAEAKDLTVAWVHGDAAAPADKRVRDGLGAYLKDHDLHWILRESNAGGSTKKVAADFAAAVALGPDAILVTMADLGAARDAIDAATARHIPVFAVDSGWMPGILVNVTTNNWQMSAEVSAYLVDLMGDKGGIIMFTQDGTRNVRERVNVMSAVLKETPGVLVLSTHDIDDSNVYTDTERAMQDYATRFGNKITAVWTPSDKSAAAVVAALKATGLRAYVSGMDGEPQALRAICAPGGMFVATARQEFETFGALSAEWIEAVADQNADPRKLIPTRTVYLPARLFTQADCAAPKP
jgi:ribose transport system substrate-binding protein